MKLWLYGYGAAAAVLLLLVLSLTLGGSAVNGNGTSTACGGVPAASFGSGAIDWPMPAGSYTLTSGFGPRWGVMHAGIDLAAPLGTPYYAAADGVVTEARAASGFGYMIVVRHTIDGQPVDTVYGHSNIATFRVAKGDTVAAGQQLAVVGNEGGSTGPHLHFEVHPGGWPGKAVDPAGWLASNVRTGQTTAAPVVNVQPPSSGGPVDLSGPVAPQGRQSTMPISGEQQANIDTIVGVAKGAVTDDPATPVDEPLRVATIAVATAMQESRITVIDYGDTAGPDSRGLFQQRDPWGPYAARMDPVESTRMFLNGGQGGQKGLLSKNWQAMSLEDAVVATQISVGGYAKWESQAMQLVAAAAGVSAITGPGGAIQPCVAI